VVHRCVHRESGKVFAVKIINVGYLRKQGMIIFILLHTIQLSHVMLPTHVSHLSGVVTDYAHTRQMLLMSC